MSCASQNTTSTASSTTSDRRRTSLEDLRDAAIIAANTTEKELIPAAVKASGQNPIASFFAGVLAAFHGFITNLACNREVLDLCRKSIVRMFLFTLGLYATLLAVVLLWTPTILFMCSIIHSVLPEFVTRRAPVYAMLSTATLSYSERNFPKILFRIIQFVPAITLTFSRALCPQKDIFFASIRGQDPQLADSLLQHYLKNRHLMEESLRARGKNFFAFLYRSLRFIVIQLVVTTTLYGFHRMTPLGRTFVMNHPLADHVMSFMVSLALNTWTLEYDLLNEYLLMSSFGEEEEKRGSSDLKSTAFSFRSQRRFVFSHAWAITGFTLVNCLIMSIPFVGPLFVVFARASVASLLSKVILAQDPALSRKEKKMQMQQQQQQQQQQHGEEATKTA